MAESERSGTGLWQTFRDNEAMLLLCLQVALLHIGQGLITPILPLYAQTFAVSTALVGFLLTAQMLPRVFVNVPAGQLADRWGAHRMLVVAAAVVTASAIAGGLVNSYWLLLLTRLLQGIGTGISQTAGFTYAATLSTPANRARFISLYQGSFLLGAGIGPIIGGFVAEYYGFRMPFFLYAAVAIGIGLWIYWRLPDPRRVAQRDQVVRRRPPFIQAFRQVIGIRGVLLVSLLGMVGGVTRGASRNMAIPLQGDALGLSEGQIGLVLSAAFFMTFIALFLVGTLADRVGRKAVIIPSWLAMALAVALMGSLSGFGPYVGSVVLFGLAFGIGIPVPAVYVADAAGDDNQGTAIGVFRSFTDMGAVIGPLLMGWIIDLADIGAGLLANAVLILVAVVAFALLAPNLSNAAAEPKTVAEG